MTKYTKTNHYTYIIRHTNGRYYVGRRSTKKDPLLDPYMGSGNWVRSVKDRSTLTKTIIAYYDSIEELKIAEMELIDKYFLDEYCMNMLYGSGGFVAGEQHPNFGKTGELSHNYGLTHSKETIDKISGENNHCFGRTGDKHPMYGVTHTEQAKQKISNSSSGDKNHQYGKTGELSPNFGLIRSKETKQKMSDNKSGKKHYRTNITSFAKLIKIRISEGVTVKLIVEEFNTTRGVVHAIKSGKTWKHITI
jgi:NUMOD3 motif